MKEERNVNVFFLIDASNSMAFASTPKLKNEYAIEFVATLSYLALDVGDRVGFALFSDKILKDIIIKSGLVEVFGLLQNFKLVVLKQFHGIMMQYIAIGF